MLHSITEIWIVRLVTTAWRRFGEDNCFALAGYLAYTGLLSLFPFLALLVMSGSFLVGSEASMVLIDQMFSLGPEQVTTAMKPILVAVVANKTGFAALVAGVVGLWAGSNAFEAARIGFNMAYDVRENRPFVHRRLQSLALAALAACVFVTLAVIIVLWPMIAGVVSSSTQTSMSFDLFLYLRYLIGLPMFALLLLVLHLTLPRARREGYKLHVFTENNEHWTIGVAPGVIASTVLWFLGATAFSLYLRYAPSLAGTHGGMAGVVITLLFFYMSSVIVFLGAQINIAREELRRNKSVRLGKNAEAMEQSQSAA